MLCIPWVGLYLFSRGGHPVPNHSQGFAVPTACLRAHIFAIENLFKIRQHGIKVTIPKCIMSAAEDVSIPQGNSRFPQALLVVPYREHDKQGHNQKRYCQ